MSLVVKSAEIRCKTNRSWVFNKDDGSCVQELTRKSNGKTFDFQLFLLRLGMKGRDSISYKCKYDMRDIYKAKLQCAKGPYATVST
jgi:hypothetical protein